MTSDDRIVVARSASRTFGHGSRALVAVHEASCVLHAGDRVALVGASGSGKSTLLHLLAGIDDPTAGSVEWPGLGDHPRRLRPGTVGVVFQGPSLLSTLDATENVALPLQLTASPDGPALRAARDALVLFGLEEVATLLPEQLSGGQAQRVAVARAIASAPRLVLADEPTGQLDHAAASMVIDALIATADATNAALLVATHDPLVADRLALRWTMDDGVLVDEMLECSR